MDYIIISAVRSIKMKFCFIKSHKRLNVALTRARKGLIIDGKCQMFRKKTEIFKDLII